MKLSVKLIEAVLIEQDPEGLIKMGCPNDEYSSEAEKIYKRITSEFKCSLIDYTSAVAFVFAESFGSWSDENNNFGYDCTYLNDKRVVRFKTIGKLMFDMVNKL